MLKILKLFEFLKMNAPTSEIFLLSVSGRLRVISILTAELVLTSVLQKVYSHGAEQIMTAKP